MIGKIRSRLTSAHLIGVVALVFALGTGLALANVPKNSVTSKKVKNGTLKGIDIRNGSLTGADVRNNSLKGADIDETTLNGAAIPGATGATGPAGPPGPPGGGAIFRFAVNGASGAVNVVQSGALTVSDNCDSGDQDITVTTTENNSQVGIWASNQTVDNDDLDPGETLDITDDANTGVLVFAAPSGQVTTLTFDAEDGTDSSFGTTDCFFGGSQVG